MWPICVFQVGFPTLPFFRVIGRLHGQRKQDSPSQLLKIFLSKILLICIFHFLFQRKGSLLKAVKSQPFPLRDFIFLKGLKFQLKKEKRGEIKSERNNIWQYLMYVSISQMWKHTSPN